jgi:dihydroorotate dehydrogenase
MYQLLRKYLFSLDPEKAHQLTLDSLWMAEKLGLCKLLIKPIVKPVTVMGLTFPNILGLAAGLDKNGDYIDALGSLGFGFIEIGSLTPRPQSGNPKPRLFRLNAENAILNRMGFNNKGVDYAVRQLQKIKYRGILGINIGKNKDTPNERALDDYVDVFRKIAHFASYVTINISSPNTENLRELQHGDMLQTLLRGMKKEQAIFLEHHRKYIPLVVKISPDLNQNELKRMADIFLQEKIDGVIATNTTMTTTKKEGAGGVSGQPLMSLSTHILKQLHELLQNQIPIIGCGGIFSAENAHEKLANGASLLQVYTGLVYRGPGLIKEILF